jgi:hypothetical protein
MNVTGAFVVLTSRCGLHCSITVEGCAVIGPMRRINFVDLVREQTLVCC